MASSFDWCGSCIDAAHLQIPSMSVFVSISESTDDLSDVGESRSMTSETVTETVTDFTDSVIDTNEKCWDITQDAWFNDVISDTASSDKLDHLVEERGSNGSSTNSSFHSIESIDRTEILQKFNIETALVHVKDLGFNEAVEEYKSDLVQMIKMKLYFSGESIISNSDDTSEMYFILYYSKTYIEIIHPDKRLSTKLKVGDYFGEQNFMTRKKCTRDYEARVFRSDNVTNYVIVGLVEPHHFNKFGHFRQALLVRNIPLIEMIPASEREMLISNADIVNYQDTDYIIKQGQLGEYLYAVIAGSVDVVEDIYSTNPDGDVVQAKKKKLVTLRAGHVFGEMSLVTKKPAVANVISNGKSSCFTVSKTLLMSSLSANSFESFLLDIVNKRKTIRSARTESMQKTQRSSSINNRLSSDFSHTNTSVSAPTKHSVKLIDVVKISKNSNGKRMVNQYEIVKLLGKGTSGEVYLCKLIGDDTSTSLYAIKIFQ